MRHFAKGQCLSRSGYAALSKAAYADGAGVDVSGGRAPVGHEEEGAVPAKQAPRAPYRRQTSDPRSLREREDFRRDHKYARYRPLYDLPWRQHSRKTYMDDAERLYGRKESWHLVTDGALREKLVSILQDYLRDTIAAARLEAKEAGKYHALCAAAARAYRGHVAAGAFSAPAVLRVWAHEQATRARGPQAEEAADASPGDAGGAAPSPSDAAGRSAEDAERVEEFLEARRRRGERAQLEHTPAMSDLPAADLRHAPRSAFPFLRQRAVEGEGTLDPSLVDWTAKYYPEDTAATFAQQPQRRAAADRSEAVAQAEAAALPPMPTAHARHRLQRSLKSHDDRYRATFDAEGVFYHVHRPDPTAEAGETRAPKPKSMRGSELDATLRGRREVVKVPWDVAARASAQGYTSDILRSKEQLIRLSRGEDPKTLP
ncbi:hypothetical protein STCU_06673 [Strigomonas culicis]|uniref:Uncharacterized protein n=1 Tax=Strigomonas culicis TaxID=28005 RepID=S9VQU2_9TRYP|nr:hypothetical protein STCU_06673 [Strigomonas culicis]|eukprot:EPY25570.1 hypothetical protein STCU_06673 [Strigomonas culicis]